MGNNRYYAKEAARHYLMYCDFMRELRKLVDFYSDGIAEWAVISGRPFVASDLSKMTYYYRSALYHKSRYDDYISSITE